MKTIIVANPAAAHGQVGRRFKEFSHRIAQYFGPCEARLTRAPGDGERLVRSCIREGYERIVVVGGDGSVNEAVNGVMHEDATDMELAYFPAGTGGDFARSIGLSDRRLADGFDGATSRRIDIGKAELTGHDGRPLTRYFANISSFGASGVIVDKVNRSSKRLGGKVSFAIGTLRGLASYNNRRVRLRVDDNFEEELVINTVAVANGRYFGGSMKVAPHALLDDGVFHVIVLGDITLADFLRYSARIYRGTHLKLPEVRELRGARVVATPISAGPTLIDLDGEQPGRLPVTYTLLPKALALYAPWDRAEAC